MYSVITTATIRGMEPCFICVEADVSDGMPYFEMVGFLSSEVKEAKERVRTALKNSGYALPPKRITVNLSPVNLRKEGNSYDLPVAMTIMRSLELIRAEDLERFVMLGEVGLDGKIHQAEGVLPIVCAAKKAGYEACIIPKENVAEGKSVSGIKIIGVSSICEVAKYLNADVDTRDKLEKAWCEEAFADIKQTLRVRVQEDKKKKLQAEGELDFSDICGQHMVKRACEVAVAGMHNFLMVGPPGSGKSMIAQRIPGILPKPDFEEQMEVSKIYSVAGALDAREGLMKKRPFRSPHHTISVQGMVGGGRVPKPGEITLSHGGVLFLDELPEFQKNVLETLRQPLEEGMVSIVRASGRYVYPADFMLVCAMNPCSCGYYPDRNKCNCSVQQVAKYLGKISRPLLDRIDISVEAPRVSYTDLNKDKIREESSAQIRERVIRAHKVQADRYKDSGIRFNSQLSGREAEKVCSLDREQKAYMQDIFERMNLTARGYYKILKVARTVADLRGSFDVEMEDLMEAIMYKGVDEKFFGEVA